MVMLETLSTESSPFESEPTRATVFFSRNSYGLCPTAGRIRERGQGRVSGESGSGRGCAAARSPTACGCCNGR